MIESFAEIINHIRRRRAVPTTEELELAFDGKVRCENPQKGSEIRRRLRLDRTRVVPREKELKELLNLER